MAKNMRDVVILDGGFSSQLSKHTTDKVDGDPLWSARFLSTNPKAVVKTHLDFVKAGSQVITTNTFQASVGGFMKYLGVTEENALQLIADGVSYAKEAVQVYQNELTPTDKGRGAKILIAGSVGPYGACLSDGSEYRGDYVEKISEKELENWHRPRISTLVKAGVDLLAFETIPAIEEARVLVRMLVKEFPDQKAWLSFSSQDGERTAHGDDFLSAVQECWALGKDQLVAIGVNCVKPSHATALCKKVRTSDGPKIPLIVYPNSGENWDHDKGWLDKHLCEPMKAFVREWIDLEVSYIGGCCRISAEDISDIKKEVEDYLIEKSKAAENE
ncbi:homocysteine S-methyltransferase YbgG-like [Ischnura elegans]|uniref:homocysteine S-methyltransferase YbgG-like n=1 Tax=Ischnura elegans TaxID=197161 RepID=UPI001ED8B7CC|nr:homocysteine S-methyltransferase YbgG-like [Ischnura elegans]XP_046402456.1 homocysteine S-methyltransferase YbgG-like [Ischnura elegans]XP_046402458.1 homocysteine S-methyltransferase YbgG-like [Ischnura elegans]